MTTVLTEIISILVAGISGIASGIGEGLTALVTSIFLQAGTDGAMQLSTFGGLIVVFAGISLAVGLSKWVWFAPCVCENARKSRELRGTPFFGQYAAKPL